ncbi:hypothetical protein D7D52_34940 [Nocardia yunnanensis]|uniref:HTH cro/C1-type domain-containing protein n=1 Tax=Nocardia yunnanensis TaxID=2382165 RepID=A0A386ZN98_9NOCA|nr:hypothetical protein [Nocardia yunnanensis]AYF78169.1 hypothetical protein D7D52_34940 [Nocardia yunnanensis]
MVEIAWTAREIKALRAALKLSALEFSRALKVRERTVAGWETGKTKRPRAASLRLLDDLLDSADSCQVERFEVAIGLRREPDRVFPRPVTLANDIGRALVPDNNGAEQADQVWVPARTADGEVVLVSLPRRSIVAGIGVAGLAAAVGVLPTAALATTPDIDHVEHFRTLRLALIESDNLHGAGAVTSLIEQSIDRMGQLRRAGIGDAVGMQRMRVLYAELAAWLYQDRRMWEHAQHWTDRALTWSHQLGDDYSIAATLIRKAHIANDQGDGAEAIELAYAAERAAPAGTRFAAVAATFAGYGSALIGDAAASDAWFDRARALADDADTDPSWGFFLDHTYIDVHQAQGRVKLGDYKGATRQFDSAIHDMRAGYTRDQAVYIARQAIAHAKAGDAEPAAKLATAAMRVGVNTGSERILHNVRDLDGLLGSSSHAEVAEFRDAGRRWAVLA